MAARRLTSTVAAAATMLALVAVPLTLSAPAEAAVGAGRGDSGPAVASDTSAPLSSYKGAPEPVASQQGGKKEHFDKRDAGLPQKASDARPTAAIQTTAATTAAPTAASFEGVGVGLTAFSVNSAPPDTDAAVGPTQIVEVVNSGFAVFDKAGAVKYGPVSTNTLFSGFGGACETTNDGDGVVRYDRAANRWVIAQFANVRSTSGPYYECVAVSTTADATGSYNRYSFQYSNFPDYPKLGVWPDGYYITYNLFSGNTFKGAESCALDRTKMLAGLGATQQCFKTSTSYGGLLPADNAGAAAPPVGAPNLHLALGATASTLAYWKFYVDWTTPGNSRFSGPTSLNTAAFSQACGGGTCIPQGGTTNQLDSLADRLMYHLSYRNNADVESLVLTHSVTAGSTTGVRWYELRNPTAPTIYQQGTYAPADGAYRWMGSAAMDKSGGIAMGYSASSSTTNPSIRYTGRAATDTLGSMTAGEGTLVSGGGSQTGTLHRWGDYASMSIDPSDDCTFWFASEYLQASGSFNWSTRIGHFALPSCSTAPAGDFTISTNPSSGSVIQGGSATSTVSITPTTSTTGSVTLSATGLPAGVTASFNPASVAATGTSTITLSASPTATPGTAAVNVVGTEGTATHSTPYTLTVTPTNNDFSLTANPTSGTVAAGSSVSTTIQTVFTSGIAQSLTFSTLGLPAGAVASFVPAKVTAGGASTMTVSTNSGIALSTYQVTVTGTDGSVQHGTPYSLSVTAASPVSNGGFETNGLAGWTSSGPFTAATSTGPHSGLFAAQDGTTVPTNGLSSIVQTFTANTGNTKLLFWWQMSCPDTVSYDWAIATLQDNTAGTTTTVLPKTCSPANTGWAQVTAAITAGHSYTLTLSSRDDNYPGDPSYTRYDDVTVS